MRAQRHEHLGAWRDTRATTGDIDTRIQPHAELPRAKSEDQAHIAVLTAEAKLDEALVGHALCRLLARASIVVFCCLQDNAAAASSALVHAQRIQAACRAASDFVTRRQAEKKEADAPAHEARGVPSGLVRSAPLLFAHSLCRTQVYHSTATYDQKARQRELRARMPQPDVYEADRLCTSLRRLCPVCMDACGTAEDHEEVELPCEHQACLQCILNGWSRNLTYCPLCEAYFHEIRLLERAADGESLETAAIRLRAEAQETNARRLQAERSRN